jgi:hypothetical protein
MRKDLFIFGEQRFENQILLRAKFKAYDHGVIMIWKFGSLVVCTNKDNVAGFQTEGGIFWTGLCESVSLDARQRKIEPYQRNIKDPTVYLAYALSYLDIIEMSNESRFLALNRPTESSGGIFGTVSKYEVTSLREEAVILENRDDVSECLNTILPLIGVSFGHDVVKIKQVILEKIS